LSQDFKDVLKGEFQVDKVTLVNREIPIRVSDTEQTQSEWTNQH